MDVVSPAIVNPPGPFPAFAVALVLPIFFVVVFPARPIVFCMCCYLLFVMLPPSESVVAWRQVLARTSQDYLKGCCSYDEQATTAQRE